MQLLQAQFQFRSINLGPLVDPGILDGHGCGDGKRARQTQVFRCKDARRVCAEGQNAKHATGGNQRNAEPALQAVERLDVPPFWFVGNIGQQHGPLLKQHTLGVIYHENWSNILSFFGLRVADIGRDQALFGFPNTRLVRGSVEQEILGNLIVPVRAREGLQLAKTNLLTHLREIWGEIPIPLLQHLDLKKFIYGYVGLEDLTMHPLVRPGSFVQIDESQRKIRPGTWQNEFERPLYFIELRGAYVCSWCEIKEGHLLSIPYSTSPCEIRRFPYPREAEVVGRVTGVAMRIAATAR
jgi:hypothetical protein